MFYLHLHLAPLHGPNPCERSHRYLIGIGYSQPISNDTVLVTDIYRQELRDSRRTENLVEVGARYQLTPQTVLSGSIGTSFTERSSTFRALIGLQHTLSWPLLFQWAEAR